jgi:hypothetical protein
MAKATTRFVDKTTVTQVEDGVTLELTHVEARVIRQVLACVGGDCRATARGIAQDVADALSAAGYSFVSSFERVALRLSPLTEGKVVFTETSREFFK